MGNEIYKEFVYENKIDNIHILIGLLNRFQNRYQAAADTNIKVLSWSQVFFIKGVEVFKYDPSIKDMANYLGCSHQNANQILKKLISLGYVITKNDETDHRKQRIFLTKKAKQFLNKSEKTSNEMIKKVFSCLSEDEINTLINSMTKLNILINELQKEIGR